MTPKEVRLKLDELQAGLGGENNVVCVVCRSKATTKGTPTAGSTTCFCAVCGEECWHHLPSIRQTCHRYGYNNHILCCGSCAEKSILAEERSHTMLHNMTAAKAVGVEQKDVRATEKLWAEFMGVRYQDPIQNN